MAGEDTLPLFIKKLTVLTAKDPAKPRPDHTLVAVMPKEEIPPQEEAEHSETARRKAASTKNE